MYILKSMGDEVEAPWKEGTDLDIEDMGDADFERRSDYLSVQDSSGEIPAMANTLSEEWGVSKAVAADRVSRMYLAHLIDEHDLDYREKYDVVTLIPPQGWTEQIEPLDLDYKITVTTNLNISVPPTVRDMVDDIVDNEDTEITSAADFLRQSILWIYEDE